MDVQTVTAANPVNLSVMMLSFGVFLFIYILTCFSIQTIANRTHKRYQLLSWFPVLQFYVLVRSANLVWWFFFLLFIPYLNIVAMAWLFICLAERLGRKGWVGLLVLVPLINFLLLPYLAFTNYGRKGANFIYR